MYYMNKEHGHVVTWKELWEDAIEFEYDDILDPTSVEYGHWWLYYEKEE